MTSFLMQQAGCLACHWVLTGDPRLPLACVWEGSKAPQTASTTYSADEPGRIHRYA